MKTAQAEIFGVHTSGVRHIAWLPRDLVLGTPPKTYRSVLYFGARFRVDVVLLGVMGLLFYLVALLRFAPTSGAS